MVQEEMIGLEEVGGHLYIASDSAAMEHFPVQSTYLKLFFGTKWLFCFNLSRQYDLTNLLEVFRPVCLSPN